MKTTLLKILFFSIATFVGIFVSQAQNYLGVPFGGTAIQIGTAVGAADKLEFENFDSLSGSVDGANYTGDTVNPIDPTTGEAATYYDASAGNLGDSNYRSGSDVDLSTGDGSSGVFLTGNQGQEFQMFTVNVLQSGMYTATVNYRHEGANKRFQVYIYPPDLSTSTAIVNANAGNPVLGRTDGGGTPVFMDSDPTTPFELTAGTWIIRTRLLDATWDLDYLTFSLQSTLSDDDFQKKASVFKAYPNPANNGQFNLNIETEWVVYNVLGVKVLEGESKTINLSGFSKGIYVLKTPFASKMLVSK
ncbi:T9SS type A sorting domain-containing protein [Gaetbulibacter sp. M240]|uniref:T9SS type A sorting domain-containing protein n=1 Tax=Gaetbulibacter sp. M240 TaxID=3126511 RepID=UPI00374E4A03